MYYLVSVDYNGIAEHFTISDCEGFFKKCCTSNAMDGTDDDMLWNGSKDGKVRVNMRKMKALTVNMETVTLIGTGRWNMTCFVY